MTDFNPGPGSIVLHLAGRTKEAVIDELLDAAVRSGQLPGRDAAREAVLARERLMSTGMQLGVAIPHGKLEGIEGIVATLGLSDEGIDFDSFDGEPSRIFVLSLSAPENTGGHLRFLSDLSLFLRDEKVRGALLAARTPEEVAEVFAR